MPCKRMGIQAHINMPSIHNDHFIQDMPVEIVLIFHTVGNLLNCTGDFLKSCRVHFFLILTEHRMNYRKKLRGNTLSVKLQAPCYQIHYVDGCVVGMCESKAMKDVYAGEDSEITFEMNLSNLAPGTYYMIVSLFTLDYMGVHRGIDDTPEKIFFKVEDTVLDRTAWLRQYWGSVRFDEIKLLKECEE